MRTFAKLVLAAFAAGAVSSSPAFAQVHSGSVSTPGVSVGVWVSLGNGDNATLNQSSRLNYGGVFQGGKNVSATVNQQGGYLNAAGIGQSGMGSSAVVSQSGSFNFSFIGQGPVSFGK